MNILTKLIFTLLVLFLFSSCLEEKKEQTLWDVYEDSIFRDDFKNMSPSTIRIIEELKYKLTESDPLRVSHIPSNELNDSLKMISIMLDSSTFSNGNLLNAEVLMALINREVADFNIYKSNINFYQDKKEKILTPYKNKYEGSDAIKWAYQNFGNLTLLESLLKLTEIQKSLEQLTHKKIELANTIDFSKYYRTQSKIDSIEKAFRNNDKNTKFKSSYLESLCKLEELKTTILDQVEFSGKTKKESLLSTEICRNLFIDKKGLGKVTNSGSIIFNTIIKIEDEYPCKNFYYTALDGFYDPYYKNAPELKKMPYIYLTFGNTPTIVGLYHIEMIKLRILNLHDALENDCAI